MPEKNENVAVPRSTDADKIGKVVMLTGSAPPQYCGVGDSAYELAKTLSVAGVNVEILADSGANETGQPVPVHPLIDKWDFWQAKKILREVNKLEPDILHIHYPARAYGKGLGVPILPIFSKARRRKFKIVVTLHEFRLSHPMRKVASFVLVDSSDAVCMPCPLELQAFSRRHQSIGEKINEAIPVGAVGPSPEEFDTDTRISLRKKIREKWGYSENDVLLLHYGTPSISKGFEVLFKALRQLKLDGADTKLVIAGDFRPKQIDFHRAIEAQAWGLGVQKLVKWAGRVKPDELASIFSACDIGVFPFLDGFSFRRSSLISLLMWDLPIITTKPDGELPDIWKQEKVIFVDRYNPASLATALLELIANPRKLELIREASNPLKENFRWDTIVSRYIEIYRRVTEET